MIGPTAGESQGRPGTRALLASEVLDWVCELGVLCFGESGTAKIEGRSYCGDQFVLRTDFLELLDLGLGDVSDFGTKEIICFHDVGGEVAE